MNLDSTENHRQSSQIGAAVATASSSFSSLSPDHMANKKRKKRVSYIFVLLFLVIAAVAVITIGDMIHFSIYTQKHMQDVITQIGMRNSKMITDDNITQVFIQSFQDLTPSVQHAVLRQLQSQLDAEGDNTQQESGCETLTTDTSTTTFEELENPSVITNTNNKIIDYEQEFPYRLTCPKDRINLEANYTLIVAYHVGMLNNWRNIVHDQLTTIQSCGIGSVVSKMFITYSNNNTDNTLQNLIDIVNLYPFAPKVSFHLSAGMPVEGEPLNQLRQYCLDEKMENDNKDPENETVAFYFHTKGSSRYHADWRDQIDKSWTYSRVLYWRKYMEYFLIERPEVCMEKILLHGAQACGVYKLPRRRFYGGNFWATSCSYIRTLPELEIGSTTNKSLYFNGEGWITSNMTSYDGKRFVGLHSPPAGLYYYLMDPKIYSDYAHRWEL